MHNDDTGIQFTCYRTNRLKDWKHIIMSLKKTVLAAAAAIFVTTSAYANNIVETAASAGSFNTLLAAAKAAGLADALATGENLTVFAPTDEAFAKLPAGTVDNLLKPENKDQLVAVLTYHVVGRVITSDMLPGKTISVKPLNADERLRVTKDTGGVSIDKASVVKADIKAENGVIHVIDSVLLPGTNKH